MMIKSKHTIYLTLFVVLLFTVFPANSFAGWVDKSDELPGMSNDEMMLYIVGGVAVIALLLIVSNSSKSNDSNEKEINPVLPDSTASSMRFDENNFSKTVLVEEQNVDVIPFVTWNQPSSTLAFADQKDYGQVMVGLTLKF